MAAILPPVRNRVDALLCQHLQALHLSQPRPVLRAAIIVDKSHRTSRTFSTIPRRAAEATSSRIRSDGESEVAPSNARLVPASASYFSGKPDFTDGLLSLQALLRQHQVLPKLAKEHAPRRIWKTLPQYRLQVGEPVKAAKYQKIILILNRLNLIHPSLMPTEVQAALTEYQRKVNPNANVPRLRTVDEHGRSRGLGRRKSSTARVWLVEGEGEVLINGKPITQAFDRLHDRESAIWALKATQRVDKYNVWALVSGGGITGQAEALTLGVARALLVHEPALKPVLRRAGCITRDPRRVERKKPGKLKARKMPAWVKR